MRMLHVDQSETISYCMLPVAPKTTDNYGSIVVYKTIRDKTLFNARQTYSSLENNFWYGSIVLYKTMRIANRF